MKKNNTNIIVLGTFFVLMLLGIIMVYSASAFYAKQYFNDHLYFLKRHLLWLFLGLIGMAIAYRFPYPKLIGYTWILLVFSGVILFYAAFIQRGRWVYIGPIHFQAVDVAKFSLILFFADSLSRKEKVLGSYSEGLFPHIFYLGSFAFMVVRQPDFSSAFMLILVGLVMLFVAPVKITHLLLTVLGCVPLLISAVLISPYKLQRVLVFFEPNEDIKGSGYQIYQSLVSLGSGGLTGVGFSKSTQKMFFLPEAHTDFIFAIIGEEWGILGTLFVIGLFVTLLILGVKIARRTEDRFLFYLMVGCTAHLVGYALINMMVTLHMVPATGLPLPFISHGGTALLFSCIYGGIFLQIARKILLEEHSKQHKKSGRSKSYPSGQPKNFYMTVHSAIRRK